MDFCLIAQIPARMTVFLSPSKWTSVHKLSEVPKHKSSKNKAPPLPLLRCNEVAATPRMAFLRLNCGRPGNAQHHLWFLQLAGQLWWHYIQSWCSRQVTSVRKRASKLRQSLLLDSIGNSSGTGLTKPLCRKQLAITYGSVFYHTWAIMCTAVSRSTSYCFPTSRTTRASALALLWYLDFTCWIIRVKEK